MSAHIPKAVLCHYLKYVHAILTGCLFKWQLLLESGGNAIFPSFSIELLAWPAVSGGQGKAVTSLKNLSPLGIIFVFIQSYKN